MKRLQLNLRIQPFTYKEFLQPAHPTWFKVRCALCLCLARARDRFPLSCDPVCLCCLRFDWFLTVRLACDPACRPPAFD